MSERLGPYEIIRALAIGGQAEVQLGELPGPGGFSVRHALKVMRQRLHGEDPVVVPAARALIAEARLLVRLTHPHTLSIHGLHVYDDRLVMVLEYVEGRSLAAILSRLDLARAAVPLPYALWVTRCVLMALDRAHNLSDEQGRPLQVVHRDVNPQNILLGYDGRCKLIDFGIALSRISSRDTRLGIVKGKLDYLSPEQAYAMGDVDHRTDIYSAGLVLYQMTTGVNPLAGDPAEALSRAREPSFAPARDFDPSLPNDLEDILARALAREPDLRYPSAHAMLQDCSQLLYQRAPAWCGDEPTAWISEVLRQERQAEHAAHQRQGTQVLLAPEGAAVPNDPTPASPMSFSDLLSPPARDDDPKTLPAPPEPPDDEELDLGELLQAIEDIYERRSGAPLKR